ncbi:MAG: hypothetical protein ACI9EF_001123, partial [Pseudohongiellaceae bacterium]
MIKLRCCLALLCLTTALSAQPSGGVGGVGDSGVVSPFYPPLSTTPLKPHGGGGSGGIPGDAGVPGDNGTGGTSGVGTVGTRPSNRSTPSRGLSAAAAGSRGGQSGTNTAQNYGVNDSWQMWWETNKFDFITLHRIEDAPLTGQGQLVESAAQRKRRLTQIRVVLDDSVLPLLRELTKAPDPAVRASAAVALCKLQDQEGATLAKGLLADGSFDVRVAAMLALGIAESGRASYQLASIAADANFGRKLLENSNLSDLDRGTALLTATIRGHSGTAMILDELLDDPEAISSQLL